MCAKGEYKVEMSLVCLGDSEKANMAEMVMIMGLLQYVEKMWTELGTSTVFSNLVRILDIVLQVMGIF